MTVHKRQWLQEASVFISIHLEQSEQGSSFRLTIATREGLGVNGASEDIPPGLTFPQALHRVGVPDFGEHSLSDCSLGKIAELLAQRFPVKEGGDV